MGKRYVLLCMLGVTANLTYSAIAQERAGSAVSTNASVPAPAPAVASGATHSHSTANATPDATEERALRLEGEKRFRTNCGRCHQAPHKFPPRVMASAIRHMRVRATITDEDMRLILRYMTQ